MPYVPRPELDRRLEHLRHRLAGDGLDGALLHGVTNLVYYAGSAQQAHLWVPVDGEPQLLVRRVLERARAESALDDIVPLGSFKELPQRLGAVRRLGMELDLLPVTLFERYRAVLPGVEVVDVGGTTRVLRSVKSAWEIERSRAAARAAAGVFEDVVAGLRDGMTELDLAIVAEGSQRRHGSQGVLRWRATSGFECPWVHVLAGESALEFSFADTPFGGPGLTPAAPYGAGRRPIGRGEPVCIDYAFATDGYVHDQTRTLALGRLADELHRAHEACVAVHRMIRAEARPGMTGEQVWNRAVAVVEDAGFGAHFMGWGEQRVQFVGHGVGLELDELPVLAPRQKMPLEPGQVIAVEPKLFFPGVGAVGLENTYVVRDGEPEQLTLSPEALVEVP